MTPDLPAGGARHYSPDPYPVCPKCGARTRRRDAGGIWHFAGCSEIRFPRPTPRIGTPEHEAAMATALQEPNLDIDEPESATDIATPYD